MYIPAAERIHSITEYYFSQKLREIEQMRKAGIDVINLGIGSPDLAPSEKTIEALLSNSRDRNSHGYQSYKGIPELRQAFSKWYSVHFGVNLDPEREILPLMGSKEGIMHITMAFVNPGDEVLIPDPGYPTYGSAASLLGGKLRTYAVLEEYDCLPDLALLENQGLEKVKLMWVNYPHMPTGAKANPAFFKELVDFGLRNQILICNDNPYSFILNDQKLSLFAVPGAKTVCLELNSLSKSQNMAGWRIGMLAGQEDYIQAVLKVKSNMDSGMFRPLQMAAAEALAAPDAWYEEMNRVYSERQIIAREILDAIGCAVRPNQAGMFLWGKIPETYTSAIELSNKLLFHARVFLTPGIIFGNNGRNHIRVSLCSPVETLKEARKRIQEFLKDSK
ncbi:MAG: aminotransferase class I/II-fold pyridoxal phosphate-dependent enzyme [Bacteroides sp.]|jgi:aspartate/methionine/tyrosine aminotransferase|nr:aminotransferase class I/II-fold pyridoxal phosphate-dependent enzyme [Bacteroides sp.]